MIFFKQTIVKLYFDCSHSGEWAILYGEIGLKHSNSGFKSRCFEFDNYIIFKMDNNFENLEIFDSKPL